MTGLNLFTGEHAVITGAASSIGRAIATTFANEGATVSLIDINEPDLRDVARGIEANGGKATAIVADLATESGWEDAVASALHTPVDMFVHSACPRREDAHHVGGVDEKIFDAMLNTNVRSGFFMARTFANHMKDNKLAGRILFFTSLHANTPRNLPHYSASKAGMTMVMKEMARHYASDGIRVNAIAPGAIPGGGAAAMNDAFQPQKKIPMQRFGSADDIAEAATALMSNRFMKYVTGETLAVDGGLQLYTWIDPPTQ